MRRPTKATVIMVALLLIAADKKDEKTVTDDQTLQGTWEYVSTTCDGEPYEVPIGVRITFAGDRITKIIEKKTYEHKYKVYPKKEPKEISLVTGKDRKEEAFTGIYSLEGDRLKWCFNRPGKPTPKTFTSKKGDKLTVSVLKRVKSEKK